MGNGKSIDGKDLNEWTNGKMNECISIIIDQQDLKSGHLKGNRYIYQGTNY